MGEQTRVAVQWADPKELLNELTLVRIRAQGNAYVEFTKKMDKFKAKYLEESVKSKLEAARKSMKAADFEKQKQKLTEKYRGEIERDKAAWSKAIKEYIGDEGITDQYAVLEGLVNNRFPTSLKNALAMLEKKSKGTEKSADVK